jgi:hypothetical protein
MVSNIALPNWVKLERIKPVAAAAGLLFSANILLGQILLSLKIQATETFLDDFAIASLGGLLVWLLLDWQADREAMIQARARALLTIRLNNEIRGAVSTMASAILFREQEDRLRIVDEAMQQVDRVLVDLTPTSSGSSNGRYGR